MPRMRMVKPDMRRSLTVASWPIPVRWTFVGLLGYVDDHGRGLDELRLMKAELYPLDDDMTAKKIDGHLSTIVDRGPLCRYVVDGMAYLHITSWTEHQKVSHPSDSRIPPCPTHDKDGNDSGTPPESPGIVPPRAGAGPRGSGNRDQGTGIAPADAATGRPRDELFDQLAAECGINPKELTPSAAGALGKALKELRNVEANPNQIKVRARRFRERYPHIALTPSALAKHWAGLSANGNGSTEDDAGWAR
jgi:hypothetical protein